MRLPGHLAKVYFRGRSAPCKRNAANESAPESGHRSVEKKNVKVESGLFALHRRVVDARESGFGLSLCRGACAAGAVGYGLAVRSRNCLYDCGCRKAHRATRPVISVGNITAGGTGKTPLAAWLVQMLRSEGRRPAILSRGYGRDPSSGLDDENQLLASLAPGVPVVIDPDRVRGAARAIQEHGADVLVLDDGFQHRRLARNLDIVLIDALCPFGGGRLLPRGLLREPLSGLRRADFIVLTRSDQVPPERTAEIRKQLARRAPGTSIAFAVHRPTGLRELSYPPKDHPLDELKEGQWLAFCGIGNPEAFRLTLEGLGARLQGLTAFPDHHRYRATDVEGLLSAASDLGCRGLVTTEKDAIKVSPLVPAATPLPVLALQVRMELIEGREALQERLLSRLPAR